MTDHVKDPYIGVWVHPETTSPLEMVGRKDNHDMKRLADHVSSLLNLQPTDHLLDLCCGNGLLTVQLAKQAKSVVGVDYSGVLLGQAARIASADNIQYLQGDARNLLNVLEGKCFNKVIISSAFQYFDNEMGQTVVDALSQIIRPNGKIVILDIPDRAQKLNHMLRALVRVIVPNRTKNSDRSNKRFQNLSSRIHYLARNAVHLISLKTGQDGLGWWWYRQELIGLAAKSGLDCQCHDVPSDSPMTHYRFDAILSPKLRDEHQGSHAKQLQ